MARLAKLTRPYLSRHILRERLFKKLDAARQENTAVWISGPPGAGKTTLIASYLSSRRITSIWYQVDRGDMDLNAFFTSLRAGLMQPRFKKKLPTPPGGRELDLDLFARNYFREFFAAFPRGAFLILDNWQDAAGSENFVEATRYALEELPTTINMVLVSRQSPPELFLRYVANRRLVQFNWEDLKLQKDEVAQIVEAMPKAPQGTVEQIASRIDGWVAGLVLLGESQGDARTAPSLAGASRQVVFNYFAQEFFNRFSPEWQRVLMACSLLPSFTTEMAITVSGVKEASATFSELERQHLFLTRHGERPDFRFHTLFAAFLHSELTKRLSAEHINVLQERAVEALLSDGQAIPAIDLLLDDGVERRAATLILQHARGLMRNGLWHTVEGFLAKLSPALIQEEPWLIYWRGRAALTHDTQSALTLFKAGFARCQEIELQRGCMLNAAGAVQAIYIEYDRQSRLEPWCDFFVASLADLPDFLHQEDLLFVLAQAFTALHRRRPNHLLIAELATKIRELLSERIAVDERVLAGAVLLEYYLHHSLIAEGNAVAHVIERLVAENELVPSTRALWGLRYGYFLRFSDVEKGDRLLAEIRAYAARYGDRKGINDAIQIEVMNALYGRDISRSRALIEEEARMLNPNSYLDRGFYTFDVACLALLENKLTTAEAKFRECFELLNLAEPDPLEIAAMKQHLAATLLKQQRIEEAISVLSENQQAHIPAHFHRQQVLIDASLAHAAFLAGHEENGKQHLIRAFERAREYEIWRIMRLVPDILAGLVQRALEYGIETDYAKMLVQKLRLSPPSYTDERWPWHFKIYTLGRFEILKENEPLTYSRKAPHRLLATIKALIALGSSEVSETKLADALWPDASGETARDFLSTSIHRLRKLLDAEALIVNEGKVSLNRERVWIDAHAFEQAGDGENKLANEQIALKLYQGDFLTSDNEAPWSVLARERLRGKFVRLVKQRARSLIQDKQLVEAIDLYQRGIDIDSLAEEFHQGQMRAYLALGRYAEGLAVYRRLKQNLSVILGVMPTTESQALFRALCNNPQPADEHVSQ